VAGEGCREGVGVGMRGGRMRVGPASVGGIHSS